MQFGHEEVALVFELKVLPAELLDEPSSFAQEMTVRLKKIKNKIMNICLTRITIS